MTIIHILVINATDSHNILAGLMKTEGVICY